MLVVFLYCDTKQQEEFSVEKAGYKFATLTQLVEFTNTFPQSNSMAK